MAFDRPVLLVVLVPLAAAAAAWLSLGLARGRTARAVLRALALAALGGAAAGPHVAGGGAGVRVALVDASASFRARREAGEVWLARLAAAMEASGARLERIPFAAGVGEGVRADETRLATALRAAVALAAIEGGDVVLVSDGLTTEEGGGAAALDTARGAARQGVPVHVHLPGEPGLPALAIEEVRAPARARAGESLVVEVAVVWNGAVAPPAEDPPAGLPRGSALPIEVRAQVAGATGAGRGEAMIPAGGGRARVRLEVPALPPGLVEIAIEIASGIRGDPVPEDERARAAVLIEGAPRVLVVGTGGLPPEEVPERAVDLAPYGAIALHDVPAEALRGGRAKALREYVLAGGGLLATGARRAFGPGDYAGTALEDALPVESRPPADEEERLALAVLLDRSGSMGEAAASGVTKLAAAALALAPLDRLGAEDRLAVVLFAGDVVLARALAPPGDVGALRRALAQALPRGPTDVFPALEAGVRAVAGAEAARKHVVLVSDGRSDATPDRAAALARFLALRRAHLDVTVSAIAVGRDADVELLEAIAREGGGRFIRAEAGTAALEEALRRELDPRAGDLLAEGPLAVRTVDPGPLASALPGPPLPAVGAVARVRTKRGARVALEAAAAGPLLVVGPVGAGRAAAFASEDRAPYAAAIDAALREIARPETAPGVTFRALRDRLQGDVRDAAGGFARGLELRAVVGERTIALEEVAPGLYEAPLPPAGAAELAALVDAQGRVLATAPRVPERPLELIPSPPDRALLREIAALAGGVLAERPEDLPPPPAARRRGPPLAGWFALAAALFFLGDLALEAALTRGAFPGRAGLRTQARP